jgi:hypothetical protein
MLLEGLDTAELLGLFGSPLALDEKIKLALEALQKHNKAYAAAWPARMLRLAFVRFPLPMSLFSLFLLGTPTHKTRTKTCGELQNNRKLTAP